MKMLEQDQVFPIFSRIGLCVGLKKFFSQANGVAGIGALNLFCLFIIIIIFK
jgi:hypothetical protein